MKNKFQKYDKNFKKTKLPKNKNEIFLLKSILITEEEFKRLEKESKPTEALKKLMQDDIYKEIKNGKSKGISKNIR